MDETFVQFKQDWGPVTCLAFRSDRNDLLISGSSGIFDEDSGVSSGHIAIWNLNERKMAGQMRDAHCGAITGKDTTIFIKGVKKKLDRPKSSILR